MADMTAKLWDGNVSVAETKFDSGIYGIKSHKAGKHNAEDPAAMVKKLTDAKVPVDGWSVWLDGEEFGSLRRPKGQYGKPYTAAQFLKIVKLADKVELVAVRRRFPAPVLKFTTATAAAHTTKANPNAPRVL